MKLIFTKNDLPNAVKQLLPVIKEKIILLNGNMGLGKTTLVKEIAKQLGSTDIISSPTFTIVNEYQIPNDVIYHFDFYRLQSLDEALDIGVEEYLYSGKWCFLEWSERILPLLPEKKCVLTLSYIDEMTRSVEVTHLP